MIPRTKQPLHFTKQDASFMQIGLDIHGVTIRVKSRCRRLINAVRRDFRYFGVDVMSEPDIDLEFVLETPPLDHVPPHGLPLFQTCNNTVYRVGAHRYVDHHGRSLAVYDLDTDRGTIYAGRARHLQEVAYLLILSRVGDRLDHHQLHRLHALAIAIDGHAILALAPSGCGKTSLGLELMKSSRVSWLSDEIPLVDADCRVHAMPLPPRLDAGAPLPWPAQPVTMRDVPRTKSPRKVSIDLEPILRRTCASASATAILHCRRRPGCARPSLRRLSRWRHLIRILDNAVRGADLPQTKAYWFRFRPRAVARLARAYFMRCKLSWRLARNIDGYEFRMSDDLRRNAAFLRDEMRRIYGLDAGTLAGDPVASGRPHQPHRSSSPDSRARTRDSSGRYAER